MMLTVGGRSLLESTLAAVHMATPIVVVGPYRDVPGSIRWTREESPGSGPVAGIQAGMRELPESTDLVAVLAADHPRVTSGTVARLVSTVTRRPSVTGAVLVDDQGRSQWLVGVWRVEPLRRRIPSDGCGKSVRSVLGPLEPELVPSVHGEAWDVDTPEDLSRAEGGD